MLKGHRARYQLLPHQTFPASKQHSHYTTTDGTPAFHLSLIHTREHTHECGYHQLHSSTHREAQSHQTLVTDKSSKQAETCTVHICRHIHTMHTHFYSLLLSLCLLLSPAHSQVWFLCTRSVSVVYKEHHTLTPRARQKDSRSCGEDKRLKRCSLCGLNLCHFPTFFIVSKLIVSDLNLKSMCNEMITQHTLQLIMFLYQLCLLGIDQTKEKSGTFF